ESAGRALPGPAPPPLLSSARWLPARQAPSCTSMISSATSPCASRCTRSAASMLGARHRQTTVPSSSLNQYLRYSTPCSPWTSRSFWCAWATPSAVNPSMFLWMSMYSGIRASRGSVCIASVLAGDGGVPVGEHAARVVLLHPHVQRPKPEREVVLQLLAEQRRRGLVLAPDLERDDVLDADQLERAVRLWLVDQDLGRV